MRFVIKNMSKPYTSLKSILAEFLPLNRTLASDDMDKTLSIIGSYMPDAANYTIENYAPLTDVWTWKVPERYAVHEAYLETEDGERIVDFKDNPVHSLKFLGSLGFAVILYTDFTDYTESHGKPQKNPCFFRVRPCNPCSKGFDHGDSQ